MYFMSEILVISNYQSFGKWTIFMKLTGTALALRGLMNLIQMLHFSDPSQLNICKAGPQNCGTINQSTLNIICHTKSHEN